MRVSGTHSGLPTLHLIFAMAAPESATLGSSPETQGWLAARADESEQTWIAKIEIPDKTRLPLTVVAVFTEMELPLGVEPIRIEDEVARKLRELRRRGPDAADGVSQPVTSPVEAN